MADAEREDVSSHAMRIARMWATVPPEHLEVALKALEPELQREHECRMERLRLDQKRDEARRRHTRYLSGLWAGFVIAVGMLAGAVVVGVNGHEWLAVVLVGPSLLALAKLFVIRRADAADIEQITQSQREVLANPDVPPA